MRDVIREAVEATIADKMPDSVDELRGKLKLWIEAAQDNNAAKQIIQADGSMADDLFVLLQLVWVYLGFSELYAKSTTELLLCKSRAHLSNVVVNIFEAFKKQEGK